MVFPPATLRCNRFLLNALMSSEVSADTFRDPTGVIHRAGIAPGAKIIAVNGRTYTSGRLTQAIERSSQGGLVELTIEPSLPTLSETLRLPDLLSLRA